MDGTKHFKSLPSEEQHWWKMRQTYVAEPWISKRKEKPVTGKVGGCGGKMSHQIVCSGRGH